MNTNFNTKFKERPAHGNLVTGYVDSLFSIRCDSRMNQFWGENKVKVYYRKDSRPLRRGNSLGQTYPFHFMRKTLSICVFSGESFGIFVIFFFFFLGKGWHFHCAHSTLHTTQNAPVLEVQNASAHPRDFLGLMWQEMGRAAPRLTYEISR